MKHSALIFWIGLALVGSAAYGSWVAWRNLHVEESRPAQVAHPVAHHAPAGPPIKDFQLVERSGRKFDSKELKGQVWIGSFFFTACPGPCWQMNQALKGVHDEFKDTDLRLVSITCDPKNDNPEALRNYADRFQADPYRWLFLTGDLDYIKKIGRDIFYQDVQEGTHRLSVLVMDRSGKIRGSFDLLDAAKVAEMKMLVKELLDEKAAPAGEQNASAASKGKPSGWIIDNVVHYLPTVNAALNATATVLLVIGWLLIKQRRETAHKRVMLTAFGVSVAFLICYLIYHAQVGSVKFTGPQPVRQIYLTILVTHVILAALVPFLAARTIYLGLVDRRAEHRRAAQWTFPIWLYVSVTGVIVYVMLYHLYPAAASGDTMVPATATEVRQSVEP